MTKAKLVFISLILFSLSGSLFSEETDEVYQVNINTASAEELAEALVGVGEDRAKAIVEYRDTQGPFETLHELMEVKGIGNATLEKNASRMQL